MTNMKDVTGLPETLAGMPTLVGGVVPASQLDLSAKQDKSTIGTPVIANATTTSETVVAKFLIPANTLVAGRSYSLRHMAQLGGSASVVYRVRVGTAGTTADAQAMVTTSVSGIANNHVSADLIAAPLTIGSSGTLTAGGSVALGTSTTGPATAAFAAATVNTTVDNYLTLTITLGAAVTLTTRAASLTPLV